MAAAVLYGTSKDAVIVQVTETQLLNKWGFGLELFLTISEVYMKKLLETIELPR